jgi:hypothetical protein
MQIRKTAFSFKVVKKILATKDIGFARQSQRADQSNWLDTDFDHRQERYQRRKVVPANSGRINLCPACRTGCQLPR